MSAPDDPEVPAWLVGEYAAITAIRDKAAASLKTPDDCPLCGSPAIDFEMDGLADKERSRDRRAWACLRKIVGGMMPDEVPQYAKGAYYDAKRLFQEVKAPDDGVKAAAPKVLIIERGVK